MSGALLGLWNGPSPASLRMISMIFLDGCKFNNLSASGDCRSFSGGVKHQGHPRTRIFSTISSGTKIQAVICVPHAWVGLFEGMCQLIRVSTKPSICPPRGVLVP